MCYYSSAGQSVRIVGTSTHVIIDKHVCTYVYTCRCTYAHTYIYVCDCQGVDGYTYICTYDIHMYVHMYTYVRTYVRIYSVKVRVKYVCTYICTVMPGLSGLELSRSLIYPTINSATLTISMYTNLPHLSSNLCYLTSNLATNCVG